MCLFNHKGGVSKTTTTFNLGWGLANKDCKVLMVDLDSQCNLTGLVMGEKALDIDLMNNLYDSRDNLTLKPIVEKLIDGQKPDVIIDSERGNILKTQNENLFLLPGHLKVSDLDSQISVSLKIAQGVPATKNIPGNLPGVLQQIAQKNGIDYMILDLSPNVGGLNQIALMSSDYFIMPTSPDYFCLQAIYSLAKTIKGWQQEIELFKQNADATSSSKFLKNKPIFLGAIQQSPRNSKPAKSFQNWIDKIRESIRKDFIPILEKMECVVNQDKFQEAISNGDNLQPYDLAYVPDFNSLIAKSQERSKPIFELNESDLRVDGLVGATADNMTEKIREFKKIFNDLSERVKFLTSP
ncbi:AAA family ATPase [Helicobacter sp. 12S02634-8]|uniref:ParA family protein n=1 Tax=Helicobacter sp. 12S02634-8 TaxID=1476199 RepID=UPI0023B8903D|nr:AAA family ATPase [Helicobacter sp. 12S02634-8]